MAIGMLLAGEAITQGSYTELTKKMFRSYPMPEDESPEGLMLQTARQSDPGWYVYDVWESKEHFQRFALNKARPLQSKSSVRAGTASRSRSSFRSRGSSRGLRCSKACGSLGTPRGVPDPVALRSGNIDTKERLYLPSYHDVKDRNHWLASRKRQEFFGPLGVTNIRTFVDPQNPVRVGVLMDVADMAAMETAAAAEAMKYDGVHPETLVMLVEA